MPSVVEEEALSKSPSWDIRNSMLVADPATWSFQNNSLVFRGGRLEQEGTLKLNILQTSPIIMSARDVAAMTTSNLLPLLWQQTLSGECDAVLYQRQHNKNEDKEDRNEWDVFSVRPSSAGMLFWDEYQKHGQGDSGQGNIVKQTGLRLLSAPRHQKTTDDDMVCFLGH